MAYDVYLEEKRTLKETRMDNVFVVFAAFGFALLSLSPLILSFLLK